MAIITVTNETGCGEVMYTKVATVLNYRLVNREFMSYVSAVSGMKEKDLKELDEKNYSRMNVLFKSYFELFSSDNAPKEQSSGYVYDNSPTGEHFKLATEKVMRMMANEGNVVVVGRGGNIILDGYPNLLNILVCADIDQRAANIAKSMSMTKSEAQHYAKETDERKSKFIKYYFDANIFDPHRYHMVLNVSKINEEKAADIICDTIKHFS